MNKPKMLTCSLHRVGKENEQVSETEEKAADAWRPGDPGGLGGKGL